MITYTCKYAPLELFAAFGEECEPWTAAPEDFTLADEYVHPNLCGFGKAIVQAALEGRIDALAMTNCCDTTRRVYDIVKATGACSRAYLLDIPHCADACSADLLARNLVKLRDQLARETGRAFDREAFLSAFKRREPRTQPYVAVAGVHMSGQLKQMVADAMPYPVADDTCTGARDVLIDLEGVEEADDDALMAAYARALLWQLPCQRMQDGASRDPLTCDPNLKGIVYHTLRFCDYYGFEASEWQRDLPLPLTRIESDYTEQGGEQLRTRVEAFAETLERPEKKSEKKEGIMSDPNALVAGLDSGSTSTDVVIMNRNREIVASAIIPTQGSATTSAEASLAAALESAGIARGAIGAIVATGYGRGAIGGTDESVTEITCHAKGAHYIDPAVRTIIDIGGQDSKAIALDEAGNVKSFAMNDKCAAGTGRFLEMMARTLGLSLEEMSTLAEKSTHDVTISNTCTVFAESEVVSLVARDTALPDIVAALNRSVAQRTSSLAKRVGVNDTVMMTGGVAKNAGVVRALEDKLGRTVEVDDRAQIAGAIGAALFALE